jgi:hypothetical protein
VADEEHVARSISSQDVFDLAEDALGIDCSFPSLDAYKGFSFAKSLPQIFRKRRSSQLAERSKFLIF